MIVFVHIVSNASVSYSHGIASLAAALLESGIKQNQISAVVVRDNNITKALKSITSKDPQFVLISFSSNQWVLAKKLAEALKKEARDIQVYAGGAHLTADPGATLGTAFDIGISGEGEKIIADLISLGRSDKRISREYASGCRRIDVPANLDALPLPHLPIFDPADILEYPSVTFSRGCPFRCSYCMSRKGGYSGKIRLKSPRRAIEEILQLVDFVHPNEINIDNDGFLNDHKWAIEFCEAYKAKCKLPFYCNARPETVEPRICKSLKDANCKAIGIGIESGSELIRRFTLDRPMSNATILKAFENAHSAGLETWSFNMVGIPGETVDDLRLTIELNDRVGADYVRVSIFTPYPGTPICDMLKNQRTSEDARIRPYVRLSSELEPAMQELFAAWVSRLQMEDRLWFTESEIKAQVELNQADR